MRKKAQNCGKGIRPRVARSIISSFMLLIYIINNIYYDISASNLTFPVFNNQLNSIQFN